MSAASVSTLPPQRILCLCLGNICRSPLAEGILRREIADRRLTGWVVDSAGTSDEHEGDCPDSRSIAIARKMGIDISGHKAQQLTAEHWREFDIILAYGSAAGFTDCYNLLHKHTQFVFDSIVTAQGKAAAL